MALTKTKKQELIEGYKSKIQNSSAIFVVEPKGLNPTEASSFKKSLNLKNSNFNVVKNTLFQIALKETEKSIEVSDGENAVVFSSEDAVEVAKALDQFIKDTNKLVYKTGMFEGKEVTAEKFLTLANLPSREVLLSQLLSVMQGPVTGFLRVINGNTTQFMNVLNAIKDQKSK